MQGVCFNCFHYAPEGQPCPYCGYDASGDAGKYRLSLQPGTILANRYLIGRVLGQGGFGITYVALDNSTKSRVALKEYMPTDFAFRDEGTVDLKLNSSEVQEDYEYGKQQFLAEAETLAEFVGNEHIIAIRDRFEANGTAYFAMEYAEGVDLKRYMEQKGGPLRIYEANRILLPIMEALQWVHSKGIVHRDISPDNIMIRSDGKAKLIDFGAARYSTGEKSKSLDVVLKHGFAPMEQYNRRGRQGSFTDVYAMAATYYYAITGKVPPDAIERIEDDTIQPPSAYGVRIRKETEEVLLKALSVSSKNRYQTMAEFYTALLSSMPRPFDPDTGIREIVAHMPVQPVMSSTPPVARSQKKEEPKPVQQPQKKPDPVAEKPKKKTPIIAIAAILAVCILAGVLFATGALGKKSPAVQETAASSTPEEDINDDASSGDFKTVGSIVTFGSYEQDNDLTNGKEPIEWVVLDVQDRRSLVISRYALDCQRYNNEDIGITWETCSLRTWLNSRFLNDAFDNEQQARIPTVTVTADENPYNDADPGEDTQDKVFLLSISEVISYFNSDEARQCQPTAYAAAQGCYVNAHFNGSSWWWLRSPGDYFGFAADVNETGSAYAYGCNVLRNDGAVRPALWIDWAEPEPEEGILPGEFQTIGSIVTFGAYEQDNDHTNGKEPIEWIVLDVQEGRSLLISRYALDCQQYNTKYAEVTWETCSLRKWLNSSFLNDAFDKGQQARIPTITVTADENPYNDANPGEDTQDKVFLLSLPEVNSYFSANEDRQCQPTAYAAVQGCFVDSKDNGSCWWWLRTPGFSSCDAVSIHIGGSVYSNGDGVSIDNNAVRPALWINLDS